LKKILPCNPFSWYFIPVSRYPGVIHTVSQTPCEEFLYPYIQGCILNKSLLYLYCNSLSFFPCQVFLYLFIQVLYPSLYLYIMHDIPVSLCKHIFKIVCLVMKERKGSSLFLDGTTINSGYKSLIVHGAKFEFKSVHGREFVTARGPLLAPILVGLTGVEGEEGEVYIKYTYEPKEDTLSSRSR